MKQRRVPPVHCRGSNHKYQNGTYLMSARPKRERQCMRRTAEPVLSSIVFSPAPRAAVFSCAPRLQQTTSMTCAPPESCRSTCGRHKELSSGSVMAMKSVTSNML